MKIRRKKNVRRNASLCQSHWYTSIMDCHRQGKENRIQNEAVRFIQSCHHQGIKDTHTESKQGGGEGTHTRQIVIDRCLIFFFSLWQNRSPGEGRKELCVRYTYVYNFFFTFMYRGLHVKRIEKDKKKSDSCFSVSTISPLPHNQATILGRGEFKKKMNKQNLIFKNGCVVG